MTTKDSKHKDLPNDPEFGLDSRYDSQKERDADSAALMVERLKRMQTMSRHQIVRARLMQLKFQMEDFLEAKQCDHEGVFARFLTQYVKILFSKKHDFAADLGISAVTLSHVLNGHRNPSDEFVMKLMVHSEWVYREVCAFSEKIWLEVFMKDQMCSTLARQNKLRSRVAKDVRFRDNLLK